MGNIGTWDEIIEAADNEHFVGRETELNIFRKEIRQNPPRKLVFFISGQGGVGKTYLLEHFQSIVQSLGGLVATSNEQQLDMAAVLGKFEEQLRRNKYELTRFAEHYKHYRELKQQIEVDPKVPKGLAMLSGHGVARAEERPLGRKLSDKDTKGSIEAQKGAWAEYITAKFSSNKDDIALMRDPIPHLTSAFIEDLNEIAQKNMVFLCFDNYEVTREYVDDWLLSLREYHPSGNIRFGIASRNSPGTKLDSLKNAIRSIPLDVFLPEEAEQFLDSYSVSDPNRRRGIVDFSGRWPVLMAWLACAEGIDPGLPTTDIVERFLRWVKDPLLRQLALDAAVPRYFNLDILAVLMKLDIEGMRDHFEWLQNMPFVKQHEIGWKYHPVVRQLMLRYRQQESEQLWQTVNAKLREYYADQRNGLGLSDKEGLHDKDWQQFDLEYLYHTICIQKVDATPLWIKRILDSFSLVSADTYHLQLARTIGEAGEILKCQPILDWAKKIQEATIASLENRTIDTLPLLDGLVQGSIMLDSSQQAVAYFALSKAHVLLKEYEIALSDLSQAIQLQPRNGDYYYRRGRVYQAQGDLPSALSDLNQAIQLQPQEADYHYRRGLIYIDNCSFELALQDFTRSIDLKEDFHNFFWRGVVYFLLEHTIEAQRDWRQGELLALADWDPCKKQRGLARIRLLEKQVEIAQDHYQDLLNQLCDRDILLTELDNLKRLARLFKTSDDIQNLTRWFESKLQKV